MIRRHRTEATRPRGWQNPSSIDSAYDEALAFLGKRDSRKVAPNTYLIQGDGNALVRYHGNLIVIYEPGRITLNSQGYRTYTTKERINWFLPAGYGLYQQRHEWFVDGPEGTWPFEDGMVLTSRGGGLGEARRHGRGHRPQPKRSYPYGPSPTGQYVLTRDGTEIMRGTEQEIWAWMHSHLGYSIEHALRYEGYEITPAGVQAPARRNLPRRRK
jgi:hypothetical protein